MSALVLAALLAAASGTSPAAAPPAAAPGKRARAREEGPARAPPAVSRAAAERLAQGDRSFLEGNYRAALFAYQDAVYLEPRIVEGHVRLGLAYFALRYPRQAMEEARIALALDPASAEARALLEECRAVLAQAASATAPTPAVAAPDRR
jgi:tetratricopeptide (TPR) repeat protein